VKLNLLMKVGLKNSHSKLIRTPRISIHKKIKIQSKVIRTKPNVCLLSKPLKIIVNMKE
jgi:hypothetical protein